MTETTMSLEILFDLPVNRVIRDFPGTVEVFNRHGIDACCGGAAGVAQAARRDGADPTRLAADLLAAIGRVP